MIEVKNLTKRYGPFTAVEDISFSVEKGQILGFLGPNGAGKSTTMKMLTGFMAPTTGSIQIAGLDLAEKSLEARARIGFLPENPPLYNDMTILDYLDFVAKLKGISDKKKRRERAQIVMEMCAIDDVAKKLIHKLSKGYRQRVGIAQAIIHDPPVIILDEPTIGLDPKQIIESRNLIRSLGGDHTVILSSHILPEVSVTCDRVLIINKGKLVAEDTPLQLTNRLKSAERLALQVRGPALEIEQTLKDLPGVLNVKEEQRLGDLVTFSVDSEPQADLRETLASTIIHRNWGLLELRPTGASLEDIFLKLTTEESLGKSESVSEEKAEVAAV